MPDGDAGENTDSHGSWQAVAPRRPDPLPGIVMYNVPAMKHLNVAEARARFGEILDDAEKGTAVVIERRGVRFRVVAEREPSSAAATTPIFDFVDAAVMDGQWSWKPGAKGVSFAPRRKRR